MVSHIFANLRINYMVDVVGLRRGDLYLGDVLLVVHGGSDDIGAVRIGV